MARSFGNLPFDRLDRFARRMKRGDERAATALYEELAEKVFGFCMNRVRSREAAEDVTQEIFLKLTRHITQYDERRGHFAVWFWKLARNTVIDYYRREEKRARPAPEPLEELRDEPASRDPSELMDMRMKKEQLLTFLTRLRKDEQELFELRYVADLSYREIAGVLGKSEGALRVAASRLRKKVQNFFEA